MVSRTCVVYRPSRVRLVLAAAVTIVSFGATLVADVANAQRLVALAVVLLVGAGVVAAATTSVTVGTATVVIRRFGLRWEAPAKDVGWTPMVDSVGWSRLALRVPAPVRRRSLTLPLSFFPHTTVSALRTHLNALNDASAP